jgi:hypothetical protein
MLEPDYAEHHRRTGDQAQQKYAEAEMSDHANENLAFRTKVSRPLLAPVFLQVVVFAPERV